MVDRVVHTVATAAFSIAAMIIVLSQCRKPRGWPGRFFIWTMNLRHTGVTTWGLAHVSIEKPFTILDVGCGGGKTVRRLAERASSGTVFGVDYSAASAAAARRMNAAAIAAGKVAIHQASVSRLPFAGNAFDLVSAVETHYYWPEPVDDLREILRVLKPGGRFVLIAETYKGERFDQLLAVPMRLLRARYLTRGEHADLCSAAGFVDIAVHEERRKGWICVVAQKPAA